MQFQAKELSMAVPLGRLGAGQFFTPQRVSHLGYFLMFFFYRVLAVNELNVGWII
jgi:hypothetical protein